MNRVLHTIGVIIIALIITFLVAFLITLFLNYVIHLFRPDVTIKVWVTYVGLVIINLVVKLNKD